MENNRRSFLKRLVQGTFVMGGAGVFTLRKDALLIPVMGEKDDLPTYANEDRYLRNATQEDIMNLCCNILDAMDGKATNNTVSEIVAKYFRGPIEHEVIKLNKELEKYEG